MGSWGLNRFTKIKNRFMWMSTGIVPKPDTRPMTYIEALKFFRDIDDGLTDEERREMIEWGLEAAALNVVLPLNY